MTNESISHYKITSKLGQGGMGEVYLARDTKLDRDVAIKILPQEISDDPDRRKRFIKEAKAASALNHPHVCVIYEVSETEDGRPFIAMEYLPGQTLDLLPTNKPLDDETVVEIGSQVADALDAANDAGIIHRDIKPANIHRDRRGRVKVLDFGLAKRTDQALSLAQDETTQDMTEPGKLMGTPSYMSPEQTRCETLDHRSDLFSLGVVLYELTTGKQPFEGASIAETVEKITREQPDAIARLNYSVSSELERIIRKCLEKKPDHRYQTARELLIDLKRLQRDTNTQVTAPVKRPKPWKSVALIGATILVGCVLLATWWSRHQQDQAESFRFGKSVAVLPFKVTSEDLAFFADGLCQELANALGRVQAFDKIPPWSSSSTFRKETQDKRQIAQAMEVSALLEGSVQRAGDQMRISATLVDPFDGESGAVMWSETYDHSHTTALPFAIQDEIVQYIVEGLSVELEEDPDRQFVQRVTASPEAYDYLLKGRYAVAQRGTGIEKAKRFFELALLYDSPTGLVRDSKLAVAYAALADTYNLQAFYGLMPYRMAIEQSRQYINTALSLDDQLAQAYASLGWLEMIQGNGVATIAAFERALALTDRYPPAYQWYASYFNAIGDDEKAAALALEALEIDAISDFSKTISAWQISSNDPQKAIELLDAVIQNQPNFALAHFIRGSAAFTHEGLTEQDAVDSMESAVTLSAGLPFYRAGLAVAYGRAGHQQKALQELDRMQPIDHMGPNQIFNVAAAHLALGDKEQFYTTLEQGLAATGSLPWLVGDRLMDGLLTEPRFIDIVQRSGLLRYDPETQQFKPNVPPVNEESQP